MKTKVPPLNQKKTSMTTEKYTGIEMEILDMVCEVCVALCFTIILLQDPH